jgi:polysaccharide biosynthesis protein PslH
VSRLLLLLPSVPAPLDAGAKLRNDGLLRLLAADNEVDVIAFGDPIAQNPLTTLARRSKIVAEPPGRSLLKRAIDVTRTDLPDMAVRLWSAEFAAAVRCFARDSAYDALQAEGIEMARYLYDAQPSRRIYDAHNAEFLLQRRASETALSPLAGAYSRLQWRRLERFERRMVQAARVTLAVSEHDANQLRALGGDRANVHVVPNGLDVTAYPMRAQPATSSRSILFLGKLDFRPNAEALRWLLGEVFGSLTEVRLFAVGAAPPAWLVQAGQHDDRIAVTGYVPDERPYLARSSVLVLPLQAGGGSRLKALVAMASGVPIVSTRVGMEGLEAEPGVHFLAADSSTEWVAVLNRVLDDASLREQLARNGRALVEQRYDWSALRGYVRAAYAWLAR